MAELYEKHNYLNKDIKVLRNTFINEYDMSAGGYSILKRAGALSSFEIEYLEKCSKLERNIYLGNKVREQPALNTLQIEGFTEARKLFFELNNIDPNSVLAIKKDAIFLIRTTVPYKEFDGFKFKIENTYNSYYNINDVEFYYKSSTNKIDTKGLKKVQHLHQDYFLNDLARIFGLAEKNNQDYLIKYLKKYRRQYLGRELDVNCYRELNLDSMFRYKNNLAGEILLSEYPIPLEELEINYNYINYIIPLIGMYI